MSFTEQDRLPVQRVAPPPDTDPLTVGEAQYPRDHARGLFLTHLDGPGARPRTSPQPARGVERRG